MNQREQILFMQIRLMQMTAERLGVSINDAAKMFKTYGVAELIEECFDLYHTEGDECVYEDVIALLKLKGALKA